MKITFLGGGNMANALIGGLLKQGFPVADIRVVEPLAENRERLAGAFGVACLPAADASVLESDVLVLSIKPQQMREALAPIAGKLTRQLVISIAAGMRLTDISRWLGGYSKLVRTMPNTPALIGAGITGLCALPEVSTDERDAADRVLRAVGSTVWIADEAKMDGVTALSGSGPAYFFYLVEAMVDAGILLGLPRAVAHDLIVQTAIGSAVMLRDSGESAQSLREAVMSPAGTTIAAIREMEDHKVRAAFLAALEAARDRSRELASGHE